MKNNARSGRTGPKGPIVTVAVRGLVLLHGGEALEGAGFPLALAPHVQRSRRPVLGSMSSRSAHGPNTTSRSFTRISLSVLDLAKAPRIVSNSPEHPLGLLCEHQYSPPNSVLRPRRVIQWVRIANLFSLCPYLRVNARPKLPRVLPRILRYHRLHRLHPRVLQNR